jgi:hypothetical protein
MKPSFKVAAVSLLSMLLGAVLGVGNPRAAQAQKLPVDCSGRKSDCHTQRNCTQWSAHTCYEFTTNKWYWYY